jgi:hypothetical protein
MAVKVQVEVFCFVMPCSVVVGYKLHPKDGGINVLQNVGNRPQHDTEELDLEYSVGLRKVTIDFHVRSTCKDA